MRIQTFSIVVGTRACNARCPFCVSKMTGFDEIPASREINTRHFDKAARFAQMAGTTTVLMTGKGEPTLYPAEITRYLDLLGRWQFPFIELQTNALELGRLARDGRSRVRGLDLQALEAWNRAGLNTIAISTVGVREGDNRAVYHEDYPDLAATIRFLHGLGFVVRLCVMMQRGCVDSPERLDEVLSFCRESKVEQLTARSIRRPRLTSDEGASSYVGERGLADGEIAAIRDWVRARGTLLMTLLHGAEVYDVGGQNLCLSDCLTIRGEAEDIRTLIFYGDGRLAYDWQYDGARLL